jgi:hypothetical protein
MAYDDRYRINPAYLNQFRNMAYNDPWFALGELVGRGFGAHMADKSYQKQMDKAQNIENAMARTSQYDEATKAGENSGLINTSTYDGILKAKDAYNQNKTIYDEAKAKLDAFEGDKNSAEYDALAKMAADAQLGMNNASANATMLRKINTNKGLSNEGFYATDSLGERLADVSLLTPKKVQNWRDVDHFGGKGILQNAPNTQQQAGTFTAPTITELAQNALERHKQNGTSIISADDLAKYAMTTPSMKDTLESNYEISKRDPQYFDNLRKELKKEGVSDEVIDEYIGGQRQNVAHGLLGEYYDNIANGKYLDADATATQMAYLDPTMAQLLKTGGVSVNNLFGAYQNALKAEQQAQANEAKASRDLATWKWKQDYINATRPSRASGGSGGSSGGSGTSEKLEAWEKTPHNLLSQIDMYTTNKDYGSAYEVVDRLKELLYRNTEELDKFPGEGLAGYRMLLAQREYDLLDAKRKAGETVDPEYFATVARNAGYIK